MRLLACAMGVSALLAAASAHAQFTYRPAGELVAGSGRGRVDAMVYAPGIRYPVERAPSFLNSQVWGVGGSQGPSGSQCDGRNFAYPWHDNYCESRSWTMPMCPAGVGHQGQDIRAATCDNDTHWSVAVVDGTVTSIGSYSVYLTAADGTRFDYLHMRSVAVTVGQRVRRGDRMGRVSNNFGGTATTVHLHFNIRRSVTGFGWVYAPTYMSLVRAYEDLIGMTSCRPSAEVCDGRDNDCDGMIDDGVSNACGGCGDLPVEICDGRDNDCDRMIDEDRVCDNEEIQLQAAALDPTGSTDLNADGMADACARSPTGIVCHVSQGRSFGVEIVGPLLGDMNGWADAANYSTIRMGDVTGDGRADVCARANDRMYCWPSTGTGFGPRIDGPAWSDAAGWNQLKQFGTIRLADVTGDGRDDLCGRTTRGFECHPSNGSGFDAPFVLADLSDANGFGEVQYFGAIRMGDLNDDGKWDLCARDRNGSVCWLSSGNAWGAAIRGPAWSDATGWNTLPYWSTLRVADVDGDHRADLCGRGTAGWRCHLFNGTTFGPAMMSPGLSDMSGWSDVDNYSTLRLGDVDGDGRADICGRANAGVFCWLWRDTAFTTMVTGPALSDATGWDDPQFYRTIRLADVNGDRRADVCARGVDGYYCWLSEGMGFANRVTGPTWDDANNWDEPRYYSTIRTASRVCRHVELCNGADDDCDGMVDEGCPPGGDGGASDAGAGDSAAGDSGAGDSASADGASADGRVDAGRGGMDAGCACRTAVGRTGDAGSGRRGALSHVAAIVAAIVFALSSRRLRPRVRGRTVRP